MEQTSSEKISEALKLLEEAATQKKDELKRVMSDKTAPAQSHLRRHKLRATLRSLYQPAYT